jgi:hypothetical protein
MLICDLERVFPLDMMSPQAVASGGHTGWVTWRVFLLGTQIYLVTLDP